MIIGYLDPWGGCIGGSCSCFTPLAGLHKWVVVKIRVPFWVP